MKHVFLLFPSEGSLLKAIKRVEVDLQHNIEQTDIDRADLQKLVGQAELDREDLFYINKTVVCV